MRGTMQFWQRSKMEPLRLVQAIGSRHKGGAQRFTMRLVEAMEAEGVQHGVLVKRGGWTEAELGKTNVKIHSLPFGGALDLVTPIRYPRILKEARANLVLTHLERATKRTPRGPWVHVARLGGYYALEDYARCDYLIGNTPGCLDYFRSDGWSDDRIFCIPNFVPELELGVNKARRSDYDTPDDAPLIVWTGRMEHEKGPDLVVRALAEVPGAYLWMVGSGRFEAELRALAAELQLNDRIRFLGWQDNVHPFLAAADIFVCASRFEVFGNVVLEGWSHRLPVVAVRSPGPEHLIRHGETGLLVPNEDPAAMAAAFREVLGDRDFAARLAAAGKEEAMTTYSEATIMAQYRALFDELLARGVVGKRVAA